MDPSSNRPFRILAGLAGIVVAVTGVAFTTLLFRSGATMPAMGIAVVSVTVGALCFAAAYRGGWRGRLDPSSKRHPDR